MRERQPGSLGELTWIRREYTNTRTGSQVWRARTAADDLVALKLVARAADPEEQEYRQTRFEAEVEAGRTLRHETLRRLLAHGTDPAPREGFPDGCDWLAFEWVDGGTLAALLRERRQANAGGLTPRELRAVADAVVNALHVMHSASPVWVHRDVKPDNVLLPGRDCREALLADMGIAWRDGSPRLSRMAGHSDSGTPLYMAPEQLEGREDLGPAADLYALALTLWQCAMGEVPYAASHALSDLKVARRTGKLLSNFTVAGSPAPATGRALAHALRPEPTDRPPSVRAFWFDFHAAGVADGLWDPDVAMSLPETTPRIGSGEKGIVPPVSPSRDMPGAGYAIAEVWLEQQSHIASFVGRTELLNRCRAWLRGEASTSYLVLVGQPGQGKSALLARLAAMEGASAEPGWATDGSGVCLLHMVKSHGEPRRILQALLWQAERLLGGLSPNRVYCGNLEDLRSALISALQRLAVRAGRVSVIIDALDELSATGNGYRFLPAQLPRGVKCVLSSRPDADVIGVLRTALASVEFHEVPPLSEADVRQFAEAAFALPSSVVARLLDVNQLMEITVGSPLVLRYGVDALRPEAQYLAAHGGDGRLDLSHLPMTADAVFREMYNGIARRRTEGVDPDLYYVRATVVKVLACAQAPLALPQLRAVLRAAGYALGRDDLQSLLDGMSQYLQKIEGMYALFHKGMADYVRREVLDADGVADVHGRFLSWLSSGPHTQEYYEAHVAEHWQDRYRMSKQAGDREGAEAAARGWLRELVSLRYARLRVEAGHVYEYIADLEALAEAYTKGGWTTTGRESVLGLTEDLALSAEWFSLLEARAHVLAEWPSLFVQELRNAKGCGRLRALARTLSPDRPILVVQFESGTRRISRLRRRSINCSPITGLWCDRSGSTCLTLHGERGFGKWHVETGEGGELESPGAAAVMLAPDQARDRCVLGATQEGSHWSGSLLRFGPDAPTNARGELVWQSSVGPLRCLAPVGEVLFAGFGLQFDASEAWSEGEVQRIDWKTGTARMIASFPRAVTHLVAAPDHSWVAVVVAGESEGEADLVVLKGESGERVCSVALPEQPEWIGCTPDGGLLLSLQFDGVQCWSVPMLRDLGTIPRESITPLTILLHPTRPLALMLDRWTARVVDLRTSQDVRVEGWTELPNRAAILANGGRLLIGDLGDSIDPFDAPSAVGVWELPDSFWEQGTAPVAPPASVDLSQPVVATLHDGRALARPSHRCLVELERATASARRAFVGSSIEWGSNVVMVGEGRLLLTSGDHFDVLDVESGQLVRRMRSETDRACGLGQSTDALRVYWTTRSAGPSPLWTMEHARNDAGVAAVFARGIPLVELVEPGDVISLPPLPWTQLAEADTNDQVFGAATLDVHAGAWRDFIELPVLGDTDTWFEMPGGKFLVIVRAEGESSVLHATSGTPLLELQSSLEPLCAVSATHLLCCTPEGQTQIVDVRDGTSDPCGLEIGWEACLRSGFSLNVSPDARLAVWSTGDAILVNELRSGREVARYPVHNWHGNLRFVDESTIVAEGYDGARLDLKLEGVPPR